MSREYTLVHEGLNQWINSPNNGGVCCQTWADTVNELNRLLACIRQLEDARDKAIALKTSSYQNANPGSFTPSEWLDLLLACQDGRTTCMRVLQIIEREMDFIRNPKKHVFWGAGEQDCPKDIKAPNGNLHVS